MIPINPVAVVAFDRRQILKAAGAALPRWRFENRSCGIAQSTESLSLALDWYPNANHAGLFLASERGYFADAGIELDTYTPVRSDHGAADDRRWPG